MRDSLLKNHNNNNMTSLKEFQSRYENISSPMNNERNDEYYESPTTPTTSIFEDLIDQRVRNAKVNFNNSSQNFEYNDDIKRNFELPTTIDATTSILRKNNNSANAVVVDNNNLVNRRRNSEQFSSSSQLHHNNTTITTTKYAF